MKEKNLEVFFKISFSLIILLVIFQVIRNEFELDQVYRILSSAKPSNIFFFSTITLLLIFLRSVRLMRFLIFLGFLKGNFWNLFAINNISVLVNNFFPLRLGDFIATGMLAKLTGVKRGIAVILMDRIVELILPTVIFLFYLLFNFYNNIKSLYLVLFVIFSIFICFILKNYFIKFSTLFTRLELKKNLKEIVFWVIIICLFSLLQYWLGVTSLIDNTSIFVVIICLSSGYFSITLSLTPTSVGVFHGAVSGSLIFFKIDPNTALAISILIHFLSLVINLIVGMISVIIYNRVVKTS